MKFKYSIKKFIYIGSIVLISIFIIAAMYYGSLPEKYDIKVGDASPYDINATKNIKDTQATIIKANQAANEVKDIMLANPVINDENIKNLQTFFDIITPIRLETQKAEKPLSKKDAASKVILQVKETLGKTFTNDAAVLLVSIEQSAYDSFSARCIDISNLILASPVNQEELTFQIQKNVTLLSGNVDFYQKDISIISVILNAFLKPNIEYNKDATKAAKDLAYTTVMNNPVTISKGTRLINFGDIVTAEKFAVLSEMDLIETNKFDFYYLAGILLLLVLIIGITLLYASKYEKQNINTIGDKISILLAMSIPLVLSLLLTKLSPVAPPVYIAAVLITAYFGFRSAIVLTTLLAFAILPMTGFDVKFLIVALSGSIIASLFTIGISKRDNYAKIIIFTTLTCLIAVLSYDVLTKLSIKEILIDAAFAIASGSLSVILSIGLMPLFEMIFNSVSPLRLIELSQPGNPLLRRLFIEAPGTSQHSVMVGNLVEAGAEAIGANSLIARVGAYYHDIGKLDNPLMFTENQSGKNPHDHLTPQESAAIILAHPEAGLRIAKRYRLPVPISRMIYEHHGTTKQVYFYRKALEYAESNNLPLPDPENFKYNCPKPSSKESAILMLADTVEAAMKSTGITNLEEGEVLIRKLIRLKIEEDQLVDSDLSFKDIELLIQAFLQVFSGHFRVRVRYPDDHANTKPAEKVQN